MRKLKTNNIIHQTTKFQVLDDNQCNQIVEAAYRVLAECGCNVHHEEARKLMEEAGCKVDGIRVRIPTYVIQKAMITVPKQVTIYNREGEPAVKVGARNGHSYFMSGLENQYRIDSKTNKKRPTTRQDAYEAGLVADSLDNIDIVSGLCCISDGNDMLSDVYETRMLLEATSKPIVVWSFNGENFRTQIEMCAAAAGGMDKFLEKPFVLTGCAASVPLSHGKDTLDKLLYMSELGLPFQYVAATMMGGTAPVTMAGALVQGLCESFVGLVISQLKNEGCPMICTNFVDMLDMSNMSFAMSSPEYALGAAATADIYKYLNLPFEVHLACTDSPVFDQQAAFDIGVQCYTALLSGANLVNFSGYLETAMSSSLEVLVYIDEILDYLRTITNGVELSEETLAEEVIKEVGPNGNFLMEEHTMEHFKENWMPKNMLRTSYEKWEEAGSKDLNERNKETVQEILAAGPRKPLKPETLEKLDEILKNAEAAVL